MSDIIDINVNKIEETIDIVANFQHPNIDITTIENIDNIEINATPNVVQININTVNGGDVEWGEIEGTLSNQTDLQNALDLKANTSDLGAVAFSNNYNDLDNLPTIPSIDNLVPYTGANQNVDLGEHQIKAGQVEFDTTPTGTAGVGVMRWNDSDGTLDLGLKGGNVTLQLGQEQIVRAVNKTATNITLLESNYQAVRVTGAQGQRLKVDLAQATNDLLSAETIGLVTETIANNQEGFITTSGLVRGINTTGSLQGETWNDGDILYLSPTIAGRITNIKPTAPNHLVVIGYVVYAHANNGSIFVKVNNGYELEELHNVTSTNYTTPIDADSVLTYDSTNSLWKRLSWSNIKSNLKTYFDTIYQTALGFTPENVANKSTDVNLGTSNTLYPTQNAVKTYVDNQREVLEFADLSAFPVTGETGKIYLALDTNFTYRWSGLAYVQLSGGINFPSDGKTYGVKNGLAERIDLMFSNANIQGIANTSGGSAFATIVTAGNGGFSQGTLSSHGYYGSIPFASISSASTLGSVANYRTMNWFQTTQNAFFVTETFVTISNSVAPLTSRMGIGYFSYAWQGNSNNNPSIFSRICFCNDNGEDFLKLCYKETQSSSTTTISLGNLFPARFAKNEHVYFCKFYFLNNKVIASIFDLVTGNYYESPLLNCSWTEGNGLTFVAHINNNTTAEVVSLGFNGFLNKFRYGF